MVCRPLILLGLAIVVSPAGAVEPPVAKKPTFDDSKLAMNVKAAFAKDAALAGTNLFVSVLDGVVAIQGPVTSAGQIDRLKVIGMAVPGVSAVKIDCHVLNGPDPLTQAVVDRLEPRPSAERPRELPPVLPVQLPSVAMGPIPSTTDEIRTQRTPQELPPPPATPRPYPTIPSPGVPVDDPRPMGRTTTRNEAPAVNSDEEIAFMLIELRNRDSRFATLTATVEDGVVTVRGEGDRSRFIPLAKTIPGVTTVR